MKKLFQFAICLLILSIVSVVPASIVWAQQSADPELWVQEIDLAELPMVGLHVQGRNLDSPLSAQSLRILEDDREVPEYASKTVEQGLQVALVIDPSMDMAEVGESGNPLQFDIANAASSLLRSGILTARDDRLATYAVSNESKEFERLSEWQHDHQAIVNSLYQYEYVVADKSLTVHEFLNSVFEDMMMATDISEGARRAIVLFTDGSSRLESNRLNELRTQVSELDIAVNVISLSANAESSLRNILSLVDDSNGYYATYSQSESMERIWSQLHESTVTQVLTYRLLSAQPTKVTVHLDESIVTDREFPQLALLPPTVTIISPKQGDTIVRELDASDAKLEELEPGFVSSEIKIDWPDGANREIQRIEYEVDQEKFTDQDSPFEKFEIPISALDEGTYELRVTAVDEYGLSTTTSPVSVNVEVDRANTASGLEMSPSESDAGVPSNSSSNEVDTVANLAGDGKSSGTNREMNILGIQLPETVEIFGVTFLVNGITILIALFPLIFLVALLLYWLTQRNDRTDEPDFGYYEYDNNGYFYRFEPSADEDLQLTQPEVSVLDAEDDLTMPVKLPSFYTNAAAYLVYVSGGDHLPKKLPIETNEPVRIGRKKSFCDQILDDKRVSRLHSVVIHEGGNFYIKDEGSSGGTFVNRRRLGTTDKQLIKNNDIINFNELEYRFEVTGASSAESVNGQMLNQDYERDSEPMAANVDMD